HWIVGTDEAWVNRLVPTGAGPDEGHNRHLKIVRRAKRTVIGLSEVAGPIGVQETVVEKLVVGRRLSPSLNLQCCRALLNRRPIDPLHVAQERHTFPAKRESTIEPVTVWNVYAELRLEDREVCHAGSTDVLVSQVA